MENLNGSQDIHLLTQRYNEINMNHAIISMLTQNSLSLNCMINILRIRENTYVLFKYNPNVSLHSNDNIEYKYDFEISKELIDGFKIANKNDCFVLDYTFDDIWSLSIIPDQSKFILHLRSMPKNVAYFKIDYIIQINGGYKTKRLKSYFMVQKEWRYPDYPKHIKDKETTINCIGFSSTKLSLQKLIKLRKAKCSLIIKLKEYKRSDNGKIIDLR